MKESIAEVINYIDNLRGIDGTILEGSRVLGKVYERLQRIMDNMGDPPTGLNNSDFIDEVIEMVYQELNDGGYGLSAKNAHKLTLFIRKLLTPKDGLVQVWVTPAMAEWIRKEGLNNQQS